MKALPLWQPWATLVAAVEKRIETRGWQPPRSALGTRIAIHATKGGLTQAELHRLLGAQPFAEVLRRALGLDPDASVVGMARALPRGAILATATLARCVPITPERAASLEARNPQEYAFGDYTPGRFAWVLTDVQPLGRPVPCKGSQGMFDLPPLVADVVPGAAPPQTELFG